LERSAPIIDFGESPSAPKGSGVPIGNTTNLIDDLDFLSTPSPSQAPPQTTSKDLVLSADKGFGLQISGAFVRRDGQVFLELGLMNQGPVPISGIAIQFNKNSFALVPGGVQMNTPFLVPGQSADAIFPLSVNPNQFNPGPANHIIQTALKATFQGQGDKVVYFQLPIQLHLLFLESGKLERDEYLGTWKLIAEEHFKDVNLGLGLNNADAILKKLENSNLFFTARRSVQQHELLYFSAKTATNAVLLLELAVGPGGAKACVKTRNAELVPLFHQTIQYLLN